MREPGFTGKVGNARKAQGKIIHEGQEVTKGETGTKWADLFNKGVGLGDFLFKRKGGGGGCLGGIENRREEENRRRQGAKGQVNEP